MKVRMLVKRPGKAPRVVWVESRKENLQNYFGGAYDRFTAAGDVFILCAKGTDEPENARFANLAFKGTMLIAGRNRQGHITGITPENVSNLKSVTDWWEGDGRGRS